jgi:hypothetical protein
LNASTEVMSGLGAPRAHRHAESGAYEIGAGVGNDFTVFDQTVDGTRRTATISNASPALFALQSSG